MGDVGCIGSIIEDMIDVLRIMHENNEISEEKLQFAMILLKNIHINCKEQSIDLGILEFYEEYMDKWTP